MARRRGRPAAPVEQGEELIDVDLWKIEVNPKELKKLEEIKQELRERSAQFCWLAMLYMNPASNMSDDSGYEVDYARALQWILLGLAKQAHIQTVFRLCDLLNEVIENIDPKTKLYPQLLAKLALHLLIIEENYELIDKHQHPKLINMLYQTYLRLGNMPKQLLYLRKQFDLGFKHEFEGQGYMPIPFFTQIELYNGTNKNPLEAARSTLNLAIILFVHNFIKDRLDISPAQKVQESLTLLINDETDNFLNILKEEKEENIPVILDTLKKLGVVTDEKIYLILQKLKENKVRILQSTSYSLFNIRPLVDIILGYNDPSEKKSELKTTDEKLKPK